MNNEKFYFSKENDKWLLNFLDNRKFEILDKEKNSFGKLYVETIKVIEDVYLLYDNKELQLKLSNFILIHPIYKM